MDDEPLPTLMAAIAAGRGDRGTTGTTPGTWVRRRARLLSAAQAGLNHARLGGIMGLSAQQTTRLLAEACDAVVRGGLPSLQADRACAERWRRACGRGHTAACARLQQMAADALRSSDEITGQDACTH